MWLLTLSSQTGTTETTGLNGPCKTKPEPAPASVLKNELGASHDAAHKGGLSAHAPAKQILG
jgi:hypothetical protein